MLTDERLAEIEELLELAKTGLGDDHPVHSALMFRDIPALLAELRRLREELEDYHELRREHDAAERASFSEQGLI